MKNLFCVLLALSLAACGKETEDPGLSREEFLDLFPLHEHGEEYVEPFYVRFYYPGGNCLLFPTDILGESPAAPVQYMFLHLDGSDVPPAELIDRAYGVDCAAATTALSFLPVSRCMSFMSGRSSGVQNVKAVPECPARPVRPIRCTYVSGTSGRS